MSGQEAADNCFQRALFCYNESATANTSLAVNRKRLIAEIKTLTLSKSQAQELEAALNHERQDSAICMEDDDIENQKTSVQEHLEGGISGLDCQFFTAQETLYQVIPDVIVTPGTPSNPGSPDIPGNFDGATDIERSASRKQPTGYFHDFLGGSLHQTGFLSQLSPLELKCDAQLEEYDGQSWDEQPLLELSNTWRQNLIAGIFPVPAELELMDNIMKEFLKEKNSNRVDFEVIVAAKLDKLIQVIIDAVDAHPGVEERFKDIAKSAALVNRRWQRIFKGRLFMVNDERKNALYDVGGSLNHLSLDSDSIGENPEWIADNVKNSSTDNFEPGDWWLNLTCAYRDGFISKGKGRFSASVKDISTVCLLKGSESNAGIPSTTKYVHEGSIKEMQVGLMTYFHKPVRILRGHKLQSKYAPAAGIRYDGMYVVRTYSHQRISMEDDLFRVEITIERLQNQGPFSEVDKIPTSSQLDDWELFLEIVDEDAKRRLDAPEYDKWRRRERFEELVKSEWLRKESFKESLKVEKQRLASKPTKASHPSQRPGF